MREGEPGLVHVVRQGGEVEAAQHVATQGVPVGLGIGEPILQLREPLVVELGRGLGGRKGSEGPVDHVVAWFAVSWMGGQRGGHWGRPGPRLSPGAPNVATGHPGRQSSRCKVDAGLAHGARRRRARDTAGRHVR